MFPAMFRNGLLIAATVVGALMATAAAAQTPKLLGTFKAWDAYSYQENGKPVCYMVSSPRNAEPKNVQRGDIYVMVTHRPGDDVRDEVSVFAGYPYQKGSEVSLKIGGQDFKLFTQGENAWTREPDDDKNLVRTMIAGSTMMVRGTSSRGTATIDSYSLIGFTAAHKAISEACGVR